MTTFAPPVGPKARHLLPGSEFGDGTLGIRGGKHLGIDFQPERPGGEDWVRAVEGGVVEALFTTIKPGDWSNPLYPGHTGNLVAIRADSGRVWVYQHGKDFQVQRGQRVKAGDRLHRMWRSGRATGNHLHLGLRVDGTWRDPERVLRNHGVWPIGNDYYKPTTQEDTLSAAEVTEIKKHITAETDRILRELPTAVWGFRLQQARGDDSGPASGYLVWARELASNARTFSATTMKVTETIADKTGVDPETVKKAVHDALAESLTVSGELIISKKEA